MLRPTDQEMTAIEKTVIFTDLKRWGQAMPGGGRTGHGGQHQGWSGGEKGKIMDQSLYCGFFEKEGSRQGKQA